MGTITDAEAADYVRRHPERAALIEKNIDRRIAALSQEELLSTPFLTLLDRITAEVISDLGS